MVSDHSVTVQTILENLSWTSAFKRQAFHPGIPKRSSGEPDNLNALHVGDEKLIDRFDGYFLSDKVCLITARSKTHVCLAQITHTARQSSGPR